MKILVLNSGSSSQKICLYDIGDNLPDTAPKPIWTGKLEWSGRKTKLQIGEASEESFSPDAPGSHRARELDLLNRVSNGPGSVLGDVSKLDIAGHRVVNGGETYTQPTLIGPEVKAAIAQAALTAPLHNRSELQGIEAVSKIFGAVPQVAVFDTGFHSDLPDSAAVYPGPYEWLAQGIRRRGFHGINHQYCAERTAQLLGKNLAALRVVTCHLGNGCSLAAIRDGHSIDTTMGFTPLEGLMMGTRSGSVDPGILTYLLREMRITGDKLDEMLNKRSGLLGISGVSSDMRDVVAAMNEGNTRAKLAFEIFVHRLRSSIGSMAVTLGRLDALVFTGGIGENSADVRAAACANLAFLGVRLDPIENAKPKADREISPRGTAVRVLTVQAQEEWAIARACWRLSTSNLFPRKTFVKEARC